MLTRVLTIALLLCVLFARPSSADPASEHLDTFISRLDEFAAQVDPDDPALKKQRKVLADVDENDLKALGKALSRALVERRKTAKLVKKAEALIEDL